MQDRAIGVATHRGVVGRYRYADLCDTSRIRRTGRPGLVGPAGGTTTGYRRRNPEWEARARCALRPGSEGPCPVRVVR